MVSGLISRIEGRLRYYAKRFTLGLCRTCINKREIDSVKCLECLNKARRHREIQILNMGELKNEQRI